MLLCPGRSSPSISTDPTKELDVARARSAHFRLSASLHAFAVCATFLVPVVGAEDTLKLTVPPEVSLCTPVNFTWTGGIPPYRLDVELSVNRVPDSQGNQRETGIMNTWFLWTPDFPAGSRLEINVVGNGLSPSSGGFTNVLPSSDSSCLNTASSPASATSLPSTSPSKSSSVNGRITPVNQPSATSTIIIFSSSGRGLSKGAIAGIAVAATITAIGLIALAAWYLLPRRSREQHPGTSFLPISAHGVDLTVQSASPTEKGYKRAIASPTVPHSGSALNISDDPSKFMPQTSALCSSSNSPEDHDPLRPTPYLVARSSTASLSQALGAGSKKHIRELSNATSSESAANMSTSASETRAMSASPDQLGSAEGQDAGDRGGDGDRHEDVLRFDARGEERHLGLNFEDVGGSDVATNSGEVTLPPPYSALLDEGGRVG